MAFDKTEEYPLLIVESSKEDIPSMESSGITGVLSTLRNKGFISDYVAHSAKENQTMNDFLETDVRDTMDALLAPLKHKIQFYSVPRHFK